MAALGAITFLDSASRRDSGDAASTSGVSGTDVAAAMEGSALVQLLAAGATCVAVLCLKVYRHRRKLAASLNAELAAARRDLCQRDALLYELQQQVAELKSHQASELQELKTRLREAQMEAFRSSERCCQAVARMADGMSNLAVTDTELRASRAQVQAVAQQLQDMQERLEATEGELGLTRSQNLLMQREVEMLRRQLRDAGEQMEQYLAGGSGRGGTIREMEAWD